jgi:hypothetical protein
VQAVATAGRAPTGTGDQLNAAATLVASALSSAAGVVSGAPTGFAKTLLAAASVTGAVGRVGPDVSAIRHHLGPDPGATSS